MRLTQAYVPAPIEHKDVFGITFEQGRNELKIDENFFSNVVTKNKELTGQANDRYGDFHDYTEIYPVQFRMLCQRWTAIGIGAGQLVPNSLYETCRDEGG